MSDHNITIFQPEGLPHDAKTIDQLRNCLVSGDEGDRGVLCADAHFGYSQPVGGTVAYQNYISPTGVGFDIGCGNKAVGTNLFLSDIRGDLPRIMDEIQRRVAFGVGQPNTEEVKDHPIFDRINRDAPLQQLRALLPSARKQLGTVGAGNHYVDLFAEEGTDRIWVGVHFGSRGFGHKIASGFMSMARGGEFDGKPKEGEPNEPPVLLHVDAPLGYMYAEAMAIAGEYAYAGRDVVVDKVLEILGSPQVFHEVHNHHNFAWQEEHSVDGTPEGLKKFWVVRKGATPLFPGQQGFVGGSMGENAVIIEGSIDFQPDAFEVGESSLWSAPHGAGRVMSRTEAKGKQRRRWYCRSCGWTQQPGTPAPVDEGYGQRCPSCLEPNVARKWVQEKAGKVDFKAVKKRLKHQGIELRGGDADEAPEAYKRLPEVIAAHSPYVIVKHQLRPIGVVMAGSNTFDPWKD